MQYQAYRCDTCQCNMEYDDCPVAIYEVAGLAPGVLEEVEVTDHPLPPSLRALLAQKVARKDICVTCRAWERQEPLVDHEGTVVVHPKEHSTRESFGKARKAHYERRRKAKDEKEKQTAQAAAAS